MPLYHFKEIWTPLRIMRIRYFRDDGGRYWYKIGNSPRRRIKIAP